MATAKKAVAKPKPQPSKVQFEPENISGNDQDVLDKLAKQEADENAKLANSKNFLPDDLPVRQYRDTDVVKWIDQLGRKGGGTYRDFKRMLKYNPNVRIL